MLEPKVYAAAISHQITTVCNIVCCSAMDDCSMTVQITQKCHPAPFRISDVYVGGVSKVLSH